MTRRSILIVMCLCIALFHRCAVGATATTTFLVTATVLAVCSVGAAPLAFGTSVDVTSGSNIENTSDITVTCTAGTTYNVRLNAGSSAGSPTVTTRKMTSGGNTLNYSLFRNPAHTQNWGETDGTDTVASTGSGGVNTHTVYGRIPSGQTSVPTGAYTDTITVTVFY